MEPPLPPSPFVWRTADIAALGLDRTALPRAGLTRVARGHFVDTAAWSTLGADARHLARARALLPRLSPHLVASHHTAAVLWGLPTRHPAPDRLHVIDSRRRSSDRTPVLARHALPLEEGDVVTVDGLRVTSPARTAVDLALLDGFSAGLIVFDGGLRAGLFDKPTAEALLGDRGRSRHRHAARAALALSSALAG